NAAGDGADHLPGDQCFDGEPETFYRDHIPSSRLAPSGSAHAAPENLMSDLSGYDLLAARLADSGTAERPLRPLYRKFTRLNDPRDLLAFCAHKSCPTCEGRVNLAPRVTNVVIVALVMVTVLSAALLLVMPPRMGALLVVSIGVVLYTYRGEFAGVVTDYVK